MVGTVVAMIIVVAVVIVMVKIQWWQWRCFGVVVVWCCGGGGDISICHVDDVAKVILFQWRGVVIALAVAIYRSWRVVSIMTVVVYQFTTW